MDKYCCSQMLTLHALHVPNGNFLPWATQKPPLLAKILFLNEIY